MKALFSFLFFLLPMGVFALSCPNNGSILDEGESLSDVLKECGPPDDKKEYDKKIITSQEWTYFKAQPDQSVTKVIFTFNLNKVVNVQVIANNSKQNYEGTNVCGVTRMAVGSLDSDVLRECGKPNLTQELSSITIKQTELMYADDVSPNTLIFHDGNLVDWR